MSSEKSKGNNGYVPSSWINPEGLKALEEKFNGYKDLVFVDWKIFPELKIGFDDGEDAFKWNYRFVAKIGSKSRPILNSFDFCEDLHNFLKKYSEIVGNNVRIFLTDNAPVSWRGSSFDVSFYRGHSSWENLYQEMMPGTDWVSSFSHTTSKSPSCPIVGVLQVKDSELIVESAVKNILPLLDYLLILENNSSDSTYDKITRMSEDNEKIIVRKILNTESGGRYLYSLFGTDTVVIKVDADEIWNPKFIPIFRSSLQSQNFKNFTKIKILQGCLHVNELNLKKPHSSGKLSDFSWVYYFGNIMAWGQFNERLHGDNIVFRKNSCESPIEIEVPKPVVLHLPFIKTSNNPEFSFKPGWQKHKKEYFGSDKKFYDLSSFEITDTLKKILKKEVWSIAE